MITDRLKKLRMNNRLSQKGLADKLGVSQQTVASWETGRTEPSNEFLNSIAKLFDVSTDYLLGNEEAAPQKLDDGESNLLNLFRNLSEASKQALLMVATQMQPVAVR